MLPTSKRQRGSVIIVTLWTITLVTILVAAIAGQIRLSARTALFHREELAHWATLLAAINQAEMELLMEKMPLPIEVVQELDDNARTPAYRYNGQALQLAYPQADDVVVRIYNHAGKINLNNISRPRLRSLLQKRLGGDDADQRQIDELMAAWSDWEDLNDLPGPNGAETEYYMSLDPPYESRNGRIETVEEILLIRGFAEVFNGVDLDAAFTIYGDEGGLLNLNVATVEAMRLVPGLDEALIAEIMAWREENEFVGNGDVAQIVPAENMAELRQWLESRETSNYYTIIAYRRMEPSAADTAPDATLSLDAESAADTLATHGYAQIVEVSSHIQKPRILKSNPYQSIPVRVDAVAE